MPPLPAAASVIKLRLIGTKGGMPWNNVMHVRYAGAAPTEAELVAWLGVISTAWTTDLAPLASTNVSLTSLEAVDLSSPTSASGTLSASGVGTRVGNSFPAQVAMVGSWHGNLRFRGGHFRTYWPFAVSTDANSINGWSPTFIAAAVAGLTAFRTAINGSSIGAASATLIGLSYFTGGALRPTPLPVTISGVSVHGRIDTQRGRLGKENF